MVADADGVRTRRWWDLSFSPGGYRCEEEAADALYALMDDSVGIRTVADVPLGAFLSGGVDSAAVVGLMAGRSARPVTTLTVGFEAEALDERPYARAVAERFGTDHREFEVGEDVVEALVDVAGHLDEPFADASFLPTWFVSRMARQAVTVALAGDGGDESFAGYAKYVGEARERRWRSRVPTPVRRTALGPLSRLLSGRGPMLQRGSNLLRSLAADDATGFFVCNSFFRADLWDALATGPLGRAGRDHDPAENTRHHYLAADTDDPLGRALYADIKTWLPGDVLVKVDRMSMSNSLEVRAPLLDYRLVEFAASLPSDMKLKDGQIEGRDEESPAAAAVRGDPAPTEDGLRLARRGVAARLSAKPLRAACVRRGRGQRGAVRHEPAPHAVGAAPGGLERVHRGAVERPDVRAVVAPVDRARCGGRARGHRRVSASSARVRSA